MKNIHYKLDIKHEWLVWKPKKGRYVGHTKYICLVSSFTADRYYGIPVIISGFNNKGVHMHLGSITKHQLENNTSILNDNYIIEKLEKKFVEYKKDWEDRRIAKAAKEMLLEL